MGIIFGVIASLLEQFALLFHKKSMIALGGERSRMTFMVFGDPWMLIFTCILIFVMMLRGGFEFQIFQNFWPLLGTYVVMILLNYIKQAMHIYNMTHEKTSVLTPFSSFDKIFSIIFGFLIFHDSGIRAFVFALIAMLIVTLSRFIGSRVRVSRYCILQIFAGFLSSLYVMLMTWILLSLEVLEHSFWLFFIGVIFLAVYYFARMKKTMIFDEQFQAFAKYKLYDKCFFFFVFLISIFLIKELGVVTTLLLSMLSLVFRFFTLSYFFNDKATKKDIVVSFCVGACILLGVL